MHYFVMLKINFHVVRNLHLLLFVQHINGFMKFHSSKKKQQGPSAVLSESSLL